VSEPVFKPKEKDFRLAVINRRFASIKEILPVMSSKGGVGKTLISTVLALVLKDCGYNAGLLDLDITNPSAHTALGVSINELPEEERGVKPLMVDGIEFMSVSFYTKDNPLPLRGWEIDNVIRELLAITIWSELDYLIIDTPPGLSDEALDVISYFRSPKPLVVVTPSPLAINSVRRLLQLLNDLSGLRILGIVENMANKASRSIKELADAFRTKYLGNVPIDPIIDEVIGDTNRLRNTILYAKLKEIARKHLVLTP